MAPMETIAGLESFAGRGAGTDAERRAALWLASELRASGRSARIETFWCRPNWPLAQAWHGTLGLAGSLLSVGSPRVGGAMILLAVIFMAADWLLGASPGRRLTRERASQNVVSGPQGSQDDRDPPEGGQGRRLPRGRRGRDPSGSRQGRSLGPRGNATASRFEPVRLIITANVDAGRCGFIHRPWLRRVGAAGRRASAGLSPGWLGWLTIMLLVVEGTAVARVQGHSGTVVGLVQLIPTIGLVLAVALLVEQATAAFGPAAGDNGSGVAAASALAAALSVGPPGHAEVELLLQGAGEDGGLGLRHHLRARRRTRRSHNTIILGMNAAVGGEPRWWVSDGPLVPLRYFPGLRRLAGEAARDAAAPAPAPVRTRATAAALPAVLRRIPTLTLGSLDERGLVPRSHTDADTTDRVDPAAVDRVVNFALLVVDGIDSHLATRAQALGATAIPA